MQNREIHIDPPETSFDLRLTNTEAEQLTALLDMAVKAGGLRVANVALLFMQKLQEGLQNAIVPASQVPTPSTAR